MLKDAHGGFAIDRRAGRGEIFFSLPGVGLLKISPDLTGIQMIDTPSEVKDVNLHNTTILYPPNGDPILALPANNEGKIFLTTTEGELHYVLEAPPPDVGFSNPEVGQYFEGNGKFSPTDVEYLNRIFYVTTGYSNLDFVLTAKVESLLPVRVSWTGLAFGGKGQEPGKFGD